MTDVLDEMRVHFFISDLKFLLINHGVKLIPTDDMCASDPRIEVYFDSGAAALALGDCSGEEIILKEL